MMVSAGAWPDLSCKIRERAALCPQQFGHEDGAGYGGVEGFCGASQVGYCNALSDILLHREGNAAAFVAYYEYSTFLRQLEALVVTPGIRTVEKCAYNGFVARGEIGGEVGIDDFGAEETAHSALYHLGIEAGDGAVATDNASHTEPIGSANDGAQVSGVL